MSSGKRKGDSYHHGDLRRALLDGALALLQDEGVGALSLREVARRAGVTHAAPYRHFESKEELIAAVAEEGFHTLRDEMRDAMAAHEGDPRRRLEACGVAYVLFAVGHPAHFGVMWSSARGELQAYPGLARASEESFQVLLDVIEETVAAGVVRRAPVQELALVAWSSVHGLASLLVQGVLGRERGSAEALALMVSTHLYQGLAAPGAEKKTARKSRPR